MAENRFSKWSKTIINRDKVCQKCGADKKLHAHHILPKEKFPEKMFDLDNGLTLCSSCHKKTHITDELRKTLSQAAVKRHAKLSIEEKRQMTANARKNSPFGDSNFSREMANRRNSQRKKGE